MGIQIQPYLPADAPAVKAFNERLRAGGVRDFKLPESHVSTWLSRLAEESLFEEFFLAKDGTEVRGGYILKHQLFQVAGRALSLGYLYSPISEALVDARHGAVGLQLFMHVLRRQPLLYCLGMGGFDNPLPRMLKAAGWQLGAVPFYFHVSKARVFFKQIRILRRSAWRSLALDLLGTTGLGGLGVGVMQGIKRTKATGQYQLELVPEFGAWVDEIWQQGRAGMELAAVRDSAALRKLYPREKEKHLKLRIAEAGRPVGWAVVLDTQMAGHKHFGDMRVGSVIDGLAVPGSELPVVAAVTDFLEQRGVDLLVTNQSHTRWTTALERSGWLSGPSNFIFGASPKLCQLLGPLEQMQNQMHWTRGDGEGPTHL